MSLRYLKFVASIILTTFSLIARAQISDPSIWPMRISSDHKYFVDSSGRPALLVGDTAWSIIVELSRADAIQYLDDRQARGVNFILVNLIEHKFTSHTPKWRNAEGNLPFNNINDFSIVNEAYFAHVDWFLQEALSRDIVVMLVPAYMGSDCGSEGFCQEMRSNSATSLYNYGRYLGLRYKNFPNIIWAHSGDYSPSGSDLILVNSIRDGIISTNGDLQLQSYHLSPEFPPSMHPGITRLDLDTVYSYLEQTAYTRNLNAYFSNSGIRPFVFIEGSYENEHSSTSSDWRAQIYTPILSGGAGFIFGNDPMWNFWEPGDPNYGFGEGGFSNGWKTALDSPGARNMARAGQFFRAFPWHELRPDTTNSIMTSGFGASGSASFVLMAVNDH